MIRTAIFIDGPAMYRAGKALAVDIDYGKFIAQLTDPNHFTVCSYYFAVVADDGEFEAIQPLLDWLSHHGHRVKTKMGTPFVDQATGSRKVRGQVATDIAVEAMALSVCFDVAVIVSNDIELLPLIERLEDAGKRVVLVANREHCSVDLRGAADQFRDLAVMKTAITRSKTAA